MPRRFPPLFAALAALFLAFAPQAATAQTQAEVAAVQAYLAQQGYDPGPADGLMGSRTREAIGAFEADRGQPVTGEVSDWIIALATGLAADSGGVGVVEVPGTIFVPLFLAHDLDSAATASLADAAGMTWRFAEGGLRFELDGFALEAAEPGATMAFTESAVILTGFALNPL